MKKLISILFLFFLGAIIALALIPFLFKDQIIEKIQSYANENINAELAFEDVSLGVFRSFPNVSVSLDGLSIKGIEEFDGLELFKASNFAVETNIIDLIKDRSKIVVKEFHIHDPAINVSVLKNGKANYDIAKATEESSTESSDMIFKIDKYSINNASINYIDESSGMKFNTSGFTQKGSGDFSSDIFDLTTKNEINSISYSQGGIPYLKKLPLSGDLDLNVNLTESKYTIKKNNLHTNDLDFDSKGYVQMVGDDINIDLEINSKEGKFSNFLSLIPGVYSDKISDYSTSGTGSFNSKMKGLYSESKNSFPQIDIKLIANNGKISGGDLPIAIQNINFNVSVDAKKSDWSDLSVNIPAFSFQSEGMPAKGNLSITRAMSNAHIVGDFDGKVDLAAVSSLVDLGETKIIRGKIEANVKVDAHQADIENEAYSKIGFEGNALLTDFEADYEKEKLVISKSKVNISPSKLTLDQTEGKIGKSDFKITSEIDNPLGFVTSENGLEGKVSFKSNYFDTTPFISNTEEEIPSSEIEDSASADIIKNGKINFEAEIDELIYPGYEIENVKSSGKLANNKLTLEPSTMQLNKSDLKMQGDFSNLEGYLNREETLESNLNLSGKEINLANFESDGTEVEEESGVIYIPTNFSSNINIAFDKIIYDDIILNNANGNIKTENGKATFNQLKSDLLDGSIVFDGNYDSNTKDGIPTFLMNYDLKKIQWSKAFKTFNTFQVLAPIGKFIEGALDLDFEIGGNLKDDMFPDLATITSKGFIHTFNAAIKGFLPLEKIGNSLGVDALKQSKIVDTKNWFEVKDGKVFIDPFDFEVDQIKFNVEGNHSFDQELNYTMKGSIPRELLRKNQASNLADQGLSYLESESQKKGVNLNVGDFIHVDVKITGTLTSPKIKVIPTGSGGKNLQDVVKDELKNVKDQLVDSIKTTVNKKVDTVKDSILKETEKAKAKAKARLEEEKQKALEKGKEVAKEKALEIIDPKVTEAVKDTVASKIGKEVDKVLDGKADEVKDKFKDLNPFKKKGG